MGKLDIIKSEITVDPASRGYAGKDSATKANLMNEMISQSPLVFVDTLPIELFDAHVAAIFNSALSASKNHLGLFNAVGSNMTLDIYRIDVDSHLTAVNTGIASSFTLLRTTAAGTGTAIAFRKLNTNAPNLPSQITALGTFTVAPTITANSELAGKSVYSEETTGQTTKAPLFEAVAGLNPLRLREGEGIVLQQSALASLGAVNIFVYFNANNRTEVKNNRAIILGIGPAVTQGEVEQSNLI